MVARTLRRPLRLLKYRRALGPALDLGVTVDAAVLLDGVPPQLYIQLE